MEYRFAEIEKKWQAYWREQGTYKVVEDETKPKFYVLDMFPYPSGAGLHVGHPLGYIASDIIARYRRHKGFNVLHPMGYDAYGLPAEQYAIQTGQHPEITTKVNTARYREQLDNIGFSYDWSREIKTCDPEYYKWTQWAFIQMFHSYYDTASATAQPIERLVAQLASNGTTGLTAYGSEECTLTAEEWQALSTKEQQEFLMNYRIAYLGETMVNWCPALGTVLANDEVSEGVSIRGGHPVEQKRMMQWCLRVSAYAERLLESLESLDWSDALKETQKNWIGKSEGAEIDFKVEGHEEITMTVFTTRADTLFGVTFMVLAPESDYVPLITTPDQREAVETYLSDTKKRTERERMMDKTVTGVFSGAYALHPITGERVPVWISDYVLIGYGTGAVMAVPAHDTRDFAFARKFALPIVQVVKPTDGEESTPESWSDALDSHEGVMIHSDFLNGLPVDEAIMTMKRYVTEKGIGKMRTNYRLRDAIFSRQRYWGEPFPIYYKEGMPYTLDESQLPLLLPEIDSYLPTENGEPPLGRAKEWKTAEGYPLELSTMPGFAGSSAYYLRYMDPHNNEALVGKEPNRYWRSVDLYIGGTEHATGHLIYSRFWNKFLYDRGYICEDEPFRRLINQGMIQGRSNFVYRIKDTNTYVTLSKKEEFEVTPIHVDVNIVSNDKLDIEAFCHSLPERATAEFILEDDGSYVCGWAIEKMSKSYYNVVNPDHVIERYGADTLRLYEMFLGPLDQSKPWDTNGIDGVHRFLKRFNALFFDNNDNFVVSEEKATPEELKSLHKMIKKVSNDIENISFNTCVSAFMICVNELYGTKCNKREILEPFVITLSPFAPHLAEEMWHLLGHTESVTTAPYPTYEESYLVESSVKYPISFNGKVRFTLELAADLSAKEIEESVLSNEQTLKILNGQTPKKVIVVPGRIVNIVIK